MAYKNLKEMKLDKYELNDPTRENFESLEQYLSNEIITKTRWVFAEIKIEGAFTDSAPYYFKHNASFLPQDIILSSVRGLIEETSTGVVEILYDQITSEFIPFSCTSPGARVRFFFGGFSGIRR